MSRWITKDDFIETAVKIKHRGVSFISSKFSLNKQKRTLSAFNDAHLIAPHWWIIPKVKERWSKMITGNPSMNYEDYFVEKHLKNKTDIKLLSLGSGICSHEMELAKHPCFSKIHCIDIASQLIETAEKDAIQKGLTNMSFEVADLYMKDFKEEKFDIVFFHASLHHFENIKGLLAKTITPLLKDNGWIVINEYVGPNRLQFSKKLLLKANEALQIIPKKYRLRYKSEAEKKSISGSGILRMIIADPSECVDSAAILPSLRRQFDVIEEKAFGGNLLVPVLKDIAHHFIDLDDEKEALLEKLFKLEDEYLENHESHYIFGVYQKK